MSRVGLGFFGGVFVFLGIFLRGYCVEPESIRGLMHEAEHRIAWSSVIQMGWLICLFY